MIEWIKPIPDPNISQQTECADKVNTTDQQSQINDDDANREKIQNNFTDNLNDQNKIYSALAVIF